MLPAEFEYYRPTDVQDAVRALAEYGEEGKVLAGGQSLIPLLKLRFAVPRVIIDINRVGGMEYTRVEGGKLLVGARTRQITLANSPEVREHCPAMAAAAPQVADPIVRNWGTIGGSLVHADPSGDMGAVLIAADAEIVARSTRGEHVIRARDFFDSPFVTALQPDELLIEVRIPVATGRAAGAYHKLERKIGDFATVGVAVSLDMQNGTCVKGGIGLTAVGPTNLEARAASELLTNRTLDDTLIAEVAQRAAHAAEPRSDIRGSEEYKRDIVRVYVKRALRSARGDA